MRSNAPSLSLFRPKKRRRKAGLLKKKKSKFFTEHFSPISFHHRRRRGEKDCRGCRRRGVRKRGEEVLDSAFFFISSKGKRNSPQDWK